MWLDGHAWLHRRRDFYEHQVGLTLARLAHVRLRRHRPDEAATTILGLADHLNTSASQRVRHTLTQIRQGWRTHTGNPHVAEADHLLRQLT
ncbi:hypothetical protein DFJ69_5831 [Thermomonospora umbrina]|uniref:Uncharacterized protein n=1 Tax=Thermomonospora umbrina TaxID=111806 RepID=A0A3D9SWH1_9ACTN|nr:hypothetical protein DFJ69_5831 [Thermomonospora umbrina]